MAKTSIKVSIYGGKNDSAAALQAKKLWDRWTDATPRFNLGLFLGLVVFCWLISVRVLLDDFQYRR